MAPDVGERGPRRMMFSQTRHRTRNGPAFGERGVVYVFWPSAERAQHGRRLVYADRRMEHPLAVPRPLTLLLSIGPGTASRGIRSSERPN